MIIYSNERSALLRELHDTHTPALMKALARSWFGVDTQIERRVNDRQIYSHRYRHYLGIGFTYATPTGPSEEIMLLTIVDVHSSSLRPTS